MKTNSPLTSIRITTIVLFALFYIIMFTCSPFDLDINPPSSQFELEDNRLPFYALAKNITPVIDRIQQSEHHFIDTNELSFGIDNPLYNFFSIFQDYDPLVHKEPIEKNNIYKILYRLSENYEIQLQSIEQLTAQDTSGFEYMTDALSTYAAYPTVEFASDSTFPVLSPFDFGTSLKCYSYITKNTALHKSGNDVYVLMTNLYTKKDYDFYEISEQGRQNYQVLESTFNPVSGDFTGEIVLWNDYPQNNEPSCRIYISGNENTHHFIVKCIQSKGNQQQTALRFTAAGISKSDNKADYFLVKMITDSYPTLDNNKAMYYKFPSGVHETILRTYPEKGYTLSEIHDPNGYVSILDTLQMYEVNGIDNIVNKQVLRDSSFSLRY